MTVDYRSLLQRAASTIAGHADGPGPGEGVSCWIRTGPLTVVVDVRSDIRGDLDEDLTNQG